MMNAVQFVIFALCIYQISAATYEEALATCRKESSLDDKTVDDFFANAAWPAGKSAPCYFNCLGKQWGVVDEAGVPNKSKLVEVASQNKESKELQVLAEEHTFDACISQAKGPSACAATENYVTCALTKAAAKPSKRMQTVV